MSDVKTKSAAKKVVPLKFDIVQMEKKGTILLNELKDIVDHKGIELKLTPTKSWYVGYKCGRKCVFCVKYSQKGTFRIEVVVSKEQFKDSGLKGNYLGNRYAEFPLNGKSVKDFAPIVQMAVDNFRSKSSKPEPKVAPEEVVKKNKEIKKTI